MKKFITFSLFFLASSSALAGDAPSDSTSSTFENFFYLKTEASVLAGNCQVQAPDYDVFGDEIGQNIAADMLAIGFAPGSENNITNADNIDWWTFDEDPCNGQVQGVKLEMDEVFFGTKTNLSDNLTLTLANTFNFTDEKFSPELSLEGDFGTLQLKESKTALDGMLKGTSGSGVKTAIDVVNKGHITGTSGSKDAYNVTYFTPSLYGLDLAFGTSISDQNIGSNDSDYTTLSLGVGYETYVGDVVISLGGGLETATNKEKNKTTCLTDDLSKADAATDADTLFDGLYGGTACGDEFLSAIGMELSFDNYTLSTAYSHLDSENADSDVWSLGFGSSLRDVDYTIGLSKETRDYARQKVSGEAVADKSTTISLDAVKPLNETVDLGLTLSSSDMDKSSQEQGNGATSAWRAGVSLGFGF
jgi:hypothetical protein